MNLSTYNTAIQTLLKRSGIKKVIISTYSSTTSFLASEWELWDLASRCFTSLHQSMHGNGLKSSWIKTELSQDSQFREINTLKLTLSLLLRAWSMS